MPTPESRVKQAVKRWYDDLRAWSFAPVQNGMGVVGIPDRIGCVPYTITMKDVGRTVGVFVAVEAKAPGKRSHTTPNQDRQLEGIRAAHGIATVVDDATLLEDLWIKR